MLEEEANEYLDERVKNGATLVVAVQGAVPALKQLRDQCLEADIPTMLGPCAPGG